MSAFGIILPKMTLQEKALEIAITQIGEQEKPRGSNWGFSQLYFDSLEIKYPKTSGIYLIRNLSDFKVYIGSAKNLEKRIKQHMWDITNNRHRNKYLQNAVLNHGFENFRFIILEFDIDCEVLAEREQAWMDHYQCYNDEFGYNIQPIAYSNSGNRMPDTAKLKISNAFRGKPKSVEHNLKNSLAKLGVKNPNYGKAISAKLREAVIASNKRRALNKTL
jgi:group I intron endonuclease